MQTVGWKTSNNVSGGLYRDSKRRFVIRRMEKTLPCGDPSTELVEEALSLFLSSKM